MLDRGVYQLIIGVGEQRNLLDAIEAVNIRQDKEHGQIPAFVRQGVETHRTKRYVVRRHGRRGRISGEELDIQRIGVIYGNHAFTVVVQILQQNFTQGVDLPGVGRGSIGREEVRLGFQRVKERSEFVNHGPVRSRVRREREDQAEIEDVFVPLIN